MKYVMKNLAGYNMVINIEVLNVNRILQHECGDITYKEVAKQVGLPENAFLAKVSNKYIELNKPIKSDCKIEFVGIEDIQGFEAYRRSAIFLMVKSFYDIVGDNGLRVFVDNVIDNGFYCRVSNIRELQKKTNISHDELVDRLRQRMKELVEEDAEFKKEFYSTDDAINLFKTYNMKDKERLFHYRRSNGINLYRLHRFQDYYYGKMLASTGYIKKFEIYRLDEGFLLQCPNSKMELTEPNIPKKLFNEFKKTYDWNFAQNVLTVADLNEIICANDGRIDELIQIQESEHDRQLSLIASNIADRKNVKFVMVAGPSSSGKTTFSKRLNIQLLAQKVKPYYLGLDNYYKDREEIPIGKDGKRDLESLDAIDVELFNEHMQKLQAGEEVLLPTYNFISGKKEYKGNSIRLDENRILVIEGIHGLNDELSYSLEKNSKYKIYISPITQLNIDEHNRIPTSDVRLLRRIVRDARTRGTNAANTIDMWKSVRSGEEKYIFPFQEQADIMFNSALIYELSVLKIYVQPLLFGIDRQDKNYSEVNRLLKFLDYFVGIDSERIPRDSLSREFIGGSFFDVG